MPFLLEVCRRRLLFYSRCPEPWVREWLARNEDIIVDTVVRLFNVRFRPTHPRLRRRSLLKYAFASTIFRTRGEDAEEDFRTA